MAIPAPSGGSWTPTIRWHGEQQHAVNRGLDRGVLRVHGDQLEPWSGLVSVNVASPSGNSEVRYVDGIPFRMSQPKQDFSASVTAFAYPYSFRSCLGVKTFYGASLHGQSSKAFDMAYRTVLETHSGTRQHRILHMIWNVYAIPSGTNHQTDNDSTSADPLEFELFGIPTVKPDLYRPTSYLSFDELHIGSNMMGEIEKLLYGASGSTPRFPSTEEVVEFLENNG